MHNNTGREGSHVRAAGLDGRGGVEAELEFLGVSLRVARWCVATMACSVVAVQQSREQVSGQVPPLRLWTPWPPLLSPPRAQPLVRPQCATSSHVTSSERAKPVPQEQCCPWPLFLFFPPWSGRYNSATLFLLPNPLPHIDCLWSKGCRAQPVLGGAREGGGHWPAQAWSVRVRCSAPYTSCHVPQVRERGATQCWDRI